MQQKFRVWDKRYKCWADDGTFYIDEDGNLYEIFEGSMYMESYMYRECVNDRYDIVWCTGLQDKEKNDIYQDDIVHVVEVFGYKDDEEWDAPVVWEGVGGSCTIQTIPVVHSIFSRMETVWYR